MSTAPTRIQPPAIEVVEHAGKELLDRLESCQRILGDTPMMVEALDRTYQVLGHVMHLHLEGAPLIDVDTYREALAELTSCLVAMSHSDSKEVRQHAGFAAIHVMAVSSHIRALERHLMPWGA